MQENGNNVIEEDIWVNKLIFFSKRDSPVCKWTYSYLGNLKADLNI